MSSVGGVGGAGGAGAYAGAGASQGSTGASSAEATVSPQAVGKAEGTGDSPEKAAGAVFNQNTTIHNSNVMSTHDHMCLSNVGESQETGMDLKKLLEMIIAIKLLQELGKASQGQ